MNENLKALLKALAVMVLALVIIVGGVWWVLALIRGVFAVAPFIGLLAGVILVGILTNGDER